MEKNEKEFDKSLKLIAKSSIIIFIGITLSKFFTYLYRIIIARSFGPETYGLFSLSIMISGWFIIFASFGLGQGMLRYVSFYRGKKEKDKIKYIFRKSLLVLFFSGVVAGALLFALSPLIANKIFNEPGLVNFLKLFSLVVPFTVITTVLYSTLRAYEKIGWHSFVSNILPTSLKVALIGVFMFFGLKTNAIIFSYVLAAGIVLVFTFFIIKAKIPEIFNKYKLDVKERLKTFREVATYSWPLLFAAFVWRIFEWTDSLVIGYFKTASDVGIYNAALPIAFLLGISPLLFMQLFFPLVNKEYAKGNRGTVKQLSKQVGKWIFAINLPVFIFLFIFSEAFLNILFGPEYAGVANALRFLLVGFLFFSVSEISTRLIEMEGKPKLILYSIVSVAILNLILNIILVPKLGIIGAAISTMTSFIALTIIFAIQSFRTLSIIPIRRKMLNLLAAAVLSSAALFYAKSFVEISLVSLILLGVFFFGLYGFLSLIFKGLDKNDFMIIRSLLKRSN